MLGEKISTVGNGVQKVELVGLHILKISIIHDILLLFFDGEQVIHGNDVLFLGGASIDGF
jgi:hypothetical protein